MPGLGGSAAGASARKAELRRRLSRRVELIDAETARAAADQVARRLLSLSEVAGARRILTCLSFGHEIDTWRLVERLAGEGRGLYVPRADPRDQRLHVHPYPSELVTLGFGLRQPPRGAPELADAEIDRTIDAVLVLGVGFDRRGFRLGHGSGYFDRFLAAHRLFAVGLAYDEQLVDRLPVETHDRPMDLVVTPTGLVRTQVGG